MTEKDNELFGTQPPKENWISAVSAPTEKPTASYEDPFVLSVPGEAVSPVEPATPVRYEFLKIRWPLSIGHCLNYHCMVR